MGAEPPGAPQRVGLCVWVAPADYDRARFNSSGNGRFFVTLPKREECSKCGSKDIPGAAGGFKWHEWARAIIFFPCPGPDAPGEVMFPKNQLPRLAANRWPYRPPPAGSSFPVIVSGEFQGRAGRASRAVFAIKRFSFRYDRRPDVQEESKPRLKTLRKPSLSWSRFSSTSKTGELGLEQTLVEYERGNFLIQHCREVLNSA